jgi:hypothetical protein
MESAGAPFRLMFCDEGFPPGGVNVKLTLLTFPLLSTPRSISKTEFAGMVFKLRPENTVGSPELQTSLQLPPEQVQYSMVAVMLLLATVKTYCMTLVWPETLSWIEKPGWLLKEPHPLGGFVAAVAFANIASVTVIWKFKP